MQLPDFRIHPKSTISRPVGSADAAYLAALARQTLQEGKRLVIFTAEAFDAQRLLDEIPFFSPELKHSKILLFLISVLVAVSPE